MEYLSRGISIIQKAIPTCFWKRYIDQFIILSSLKPNVGHTFNFTEKDLLEAHALSETHHSKGKIVIKIK